MHDHFVAGKWIRGEGVLFHSTNPSTGEEFFHTRHGSVIEVRAALRAGADAFPNWADRTFEERAAIARRFAEVAQSRREEFEHTISTETGKPRWEAKQETDTVLKKIELSIEAYGQRTGTKSEKSGTTLSVLSHSPHGIVTVLGPFNFPAHLPNGHIVPALIAGN
ncbi:MAG TPA: aldehyde dehydrogenase family protein, partial [Chthoniobacterales bacterium]|nr:aldehyde dehydrogenase family protein [Chthoniobacterales bacterium]